MHFFEDETKIEIPSEIYSPLIPLLTLTINRHQTLFILLGQDITLYILILIFTYITNIFNQFASSNNLAKMRNRGSISLKLVAKLMVKAGFNHIITVDMHSKGTIHTIAFFNLIIFFHHNYLLCKVKTKQTFSFQLLRFFRVLI